MYDKKGTFWREIEFWYTMRTGVTTGMKLFSYVAALEFDFKNIHATLPVAPGGDTQDRPDVQLSKFSLDRLENFK
jgi:hypothetical protein